MMGGGGLAAPLAAHVHMIGWLGTRADPVVFSNDAR